MKEFIKSEWEKVAVMCPTKEESKAVNELIEKLGGRDLQYEWKSYGSNTAFCLDLPSNTFCRTSFFKEREYKLITSQEFLNTFKENMKPQHVFIQGSEALIQAFRKESEALGYYYNEDSGKYGSNSIVINSCAVDHLTLESYKELYISGSKTKREHQLHFQLPAQYTEALAYLQNALNPSNWLPEFKVGDIVVIGEENEFGHLTGTIGKIVQLGKIYADIESHLSNKFSFRSHSFINLIPATPEQIAEFNKPVYKEGDMLIASIADSRYIGKYKGVWMDTQFELMDWCISQDGKIISTEYKNYGTFTRIERLATKEEIADWKKIGEPKTTTLVLGSSNISITIGKNLIKAEGKEFSYQSIKETVDLMMGTTSSSFAGYEVSFNSVKVGCSNFSCLQLLEICNTYENLNGLPLSHYYPF